jgi:hypothetical protein
MILCSDHLRQRWRQLQRVALQEEQRRAAVREVDVTWRQHSSMAPSRRPRLLMGASTTRTTTTQHPQHPLLVDPYQVLQVRRDATRSELRQAYRKLALWHHPGRTCGGREKRARRATLLRCHDASTRNLHKCVRGKGRVLDKYVYLNDAFVVGVSSIGSVVRRAGQSIQYLSPRRGSLARPRQKNKQRRPSQHSVRRAEIP